MLQLKKLSLCGKWKRNVYCVCRYASDLMTTRKFQPNPIHLTHNQLFMSCQACRRAFTLSAFYPPKSPFWQPIGHWCTTYHVFPFLRLALPSNYSLSPSCIEIAIAPALKRAERLQTFTFHVEHGDELVPQSSEMWLSNNFQLIKRETTTNLNSFQSSKHKRR